MLTKTQPQLVLKKSEKAIAAPAVPPRNKKIADLLQEIRNAAKKKWKKRSKRSLRPCNVRVDNDGKIIQMFGNASTNDINQNTAYVHRIERSMSLSEIMSSCTKIRNVSLRISLGDALQRIVTMIESGELDDRANVKTTILITNPCGIEQYRITVDHTPLYFAVYLTKTTGHYAFSKKDGILLLENPPKTESLN